MKLRLDERTIFKILNNGETDIVDGLESENKWNINIIMEIDLLLK